MIQHRRNEFRCVDHESLEVKIAVPHHWMVRLVPFEHIRDDLGATDCKRELDDESIVFEVGDDKPSALELRPTSIEIFSHARSTLGSIRSHKTFGYSYFSMASIVRVYGG